MRLPTKITIGVHSTKMLEMGRFFARRALMTLTMQSGRWAAKKLKRMSGTQMSTIDNLPRMDSKPSSDESGARQMPAP